MLEVSKSISVCLNLSVQLISRQPAYQPQKRSSEQGVKAEKENPCLETILRDSLYPSLGINIQILIKKILEQHLSWLSKYNYFLFQFMQY